MIKEKIIPIHNIHCSLLFYHTEGYSFKNKLNFLIQCSDEKVHVSGNYAPTKVFAMPYGAYGAGPYGAEVLVVTDTHILLSTTMRLIPQFMRNLM